MALRFHWKVVLKKAVRNISREIKNQDEHKSETCGTVLLKKPHSRNVEYFDLRRERVEVVLTFDVLASSTSC